MGGGRGWLRGGSGRVFPPPGYRICTGSLGAFPPPSPPAKKATARQDQTGQASTDDGAWHHKAPDLTTAEVHSVDVKIGPLGFDSRNQLRLSIREPALRRDEGGIPDPGVR